MVSIALLSHRGGNIGHDFMAIGCEIILKRTFSDEAEIQHFEQHRPFEVYPEGHWLRIINRLPHGRWQLVRRLMNQPNLRRWLWRHTKPLNFDLAVACGGPNIVPGTYKSPEMGLMLHHMNGAFKFRGVPLADLAVGSCVPLERKVAFDDRDAVFFREMLDNCAVTTVREPHARKVCQSFGRDVPLIPCAAIASGHYFEQFREPDDAGKYVLVNFQRLGANTDWGQGVDPIQWMATMRRVIDDLGQRHQIRLLAQNDVERELAKTLAPHAACLSPTTYEDYGRAIGGAKAGLVSRIHAALPLAGIGVPSVVVGTDTRLLTAAQIGLETKFVKEATADWLVDSVETAIRTRQEQRQRLLAVREETVRTYAKVLEGCIR